MDTSKLTEKLQARRSEIKEQMESLVPGAAVSTDDGIAFGERVGEDKSAAEQRMTQLNIHSGLEAELETVDAALTKIDNGTYGNCEVCGNPIGHDRLEALPWAISCINCA